MSPQSALTHAEVDYREANIDSRIQRYLTASSHEHSDELFADFIMATDMTYVLKWDSKWCDPVDSSSAKSRRARAALCPGKVESTIAHITLSGGGDGQSTSRSRYSPRQVTFSSHQITKIIMPFGGRLAYFAWPLGLLCLHLARLLPGDFSQPSPTAFARAPERPGRPSLPVVTALGHRSSLSGYRDTSAESWEAPLHLQHVKIALLSR
ncbi:hypothetical protein EDB85DRAFT_2160237 [Lactarius pseudohatsudake]|nr:hypothetical protein EDB85DRAFT_2160237 [Lactarius pseudohatsudake]